MGLAAQQVYNPNEVIFTANGQNHNQWVGAQYVFYLVNNAQEVSTDRSSLLTKMIRATSDSLA